MRSPYLQGVLCGLETLCVTWDSVSLVVFFSQWAGPPQGPWSWRHLMTLEMTLEMKCLWAPELLCTATLGPQTPFG